MTTMASARKPMLMRKKKVRAELVREMLKRLRATGVKT